MENNLDSGVRQGPFALYRGSDFFESFIPSIWFLLGMIVVEMLFFGTGTVHTALQELVRLRNAVAVTTDETAIERHTGSKSAATHDSPEADHRAAKRDGDSDAVQVSLSLEIFFILLLAVVVISLVFILGQIMNGLSAAILDRVVVKKLLHYPFDLYQRWQREPNHASHKIVRLAVLQASYLVHCVNLIPLCLLEVMIAEINVPAIETGRLGLTWSSVIAVLVILHLGAPAISSRRKYDELNGRSGSVFVAVHIMVLVCVAWALIARVQQSRDFSWVLVLFVMNVVIAILDRVLGWAGDQSQNPRRRSLLLHARVVS